MKRKAIYLILIVLILFLSAACSPAGDQDDLALDFLRANPTCGEVGCTNSGCWCIRWVEVPK